MRSRASGRERAASNRPVRAGRRLTDARADASPIVARRIAGTSRAFCYMRRSNLHEACG
ncbi:hypothetical protein C7S16_5452 [Burkholderia thailandensis]|uniref:Uncharacterized protein n=1 Tax=Burkholderia thailandensis TaxID=57975 RepID=A0AAW9CPN5_BURTH|nr:hypothetical protein [Burkholderia thailandensis]MDW9252818.1 hypothetical protein [Burkholderia thailandensis]